MQSILHAILQNDLSAFKSLVEERESSLEEINKEDGLNNTVLHMAAELGHRELVSKIIELRPSLVLSRNVHGNTPLHISADVNIVAQILETGLDVCSARNVLGYRPLNVACRSKFIDAAKLIAKKTPSIDLSELISAISNGSTSVSKIILKRFPDLAREEAWIGEDGSQSTLLHHACEKGYVELTSILLGLDQGLEEAVNTKGLTPLHLAVIRGSVEILEEFLAKVPSSFRSLTRSKETVFHLATRNKRMDAFVFMAESLGINSQILLQLTDENDNTVLHIAASVACDISFIRCIVDNKIVPLDLMYKNKMGLEAFQLLPREAQDFELLSRLLRLGTHTSEEVESQNNLKHEGLGPSDNDTRSHEKEVIRLLTEIAEQKRSKEHKVKIGRESLEYKMYIEALQNARNMIAIVAVLIASVAYAGGINPPGGVYQDGPLRGKSMVGKTKAFKVFAICNNIALFTSLCIVIVLVSIIPYKSQTLKRLLVATHRMMWVSVVFMATAFIAASWVVIPHYNGTRWLFPAIIVVAGGVLTLVSLYLGFETIRHRFEKKNPPANLPANLPSSATSTGRDITKSELVVAGSLGYCTLLSIHACPKPSYGTVVRMRRKKGRTR